MRWALAACLWAGAALGHGAPPRPLSVAHQPGQPGSAVVSTTFGGLLSDDDGVSFAWLCEEALGLLPAERPVLAYSASGRLFAATFGQLMRSTDRGCTFTSLPQFADTGASDLAFDGATVLVTTSRFGQANTLWRSRDDGDTFVATSVSSAGEFLSGVELAPSLPARVYVSAWYHQPRSMALLVSDDGGDSFTRIDLSNALPAQGPLTVLAVSPAQPDVVFASLTEDAATPRSWVLRSLDAGRSFAPVLTLTEGVFQVAVQAGGQTVWVAAGDQLYRSDDGGAAFTLQARPSRETCATVSAGATYLCGRPDPDGFAIARPDGAGGLTPWLTWNRINRVVTCAGGSRTEDVCSPFLPVLHAQLGVDPSTVVPLDGGVSNPPPPPQGCGCQSGGAQPLLLALLGALLARCFRSRRVL